MTREYLILFEILDDCYRRGANDDLPALLGEMSPNIFADGMPADTMVYDDWRLKCQNMNGSLEWKQAIVNLLEEYEWKFHFCFEETKKILNEITPNELNEMIDHHR